MSFLHHPLVMTLHWTCMAAMIGFCLDPTGIGATIGNYVGHIGDGLGNIFNAVAGNGLATAGGMHAAHAGHAAGLSAATLPAVAVDPTAHLAASTPGLTEAFSSRSEWFAHQPAELQAALQQQSATSGLSLADITSGYCDPAGAPVPAKW